MTVLADPPTLDHALPGPDARVARAAALVDAVERWSAGRGNERHVRRSAAEARAELARGTDPRAVAAGIWELVRGTAADRAVTLTDLDAGSAVDLVAPGTRVVSAGTDSDTATAALSGTSMATPHVAGAVARLLQGSPAATPAEVASRITATATQGRVTGAGLGSPNRLLYVDPAS